jgi:beta-glucosidase
VTVRRADRPNALPAGLAALALVVPLALVGLAAPAVAAPGDLALSSSVATFGNPVTARVTVAGGTAAGSVKVLVDGAPVDTVPLAADGTTQVRLPADVAPGRHRVTAVFGGAPSADAPVLGSTSAGVVLTVTRTLPTVGTDGTDWTVRRGDPKDVHVQATGVAEVTPTGTVDVWVNGSRKGSATLDPRGTALVSLPKGTRSALVVVTYAGDGTYLPWVAAPHPLVVR